jgi:ADP-heptose:LPS heptosyltransferase
VGAKTEDKTFSIKVDDAKIRGIFGQDIENCSSLVAVHPWTSDPLKQWPIENFVALSRRIAKELKKGVLIIGGNDEYGRSRVYFGDSEPGVFNLTAKTTLVQLAALLKKCKLLISGDSGPVHLACSVGIPVLAIFRNDLAGKAPERWGPWGAGNAVIEKNRLSDITLDEVFYKAKEMLAR